VRNIIQDTNYRIYSTLFWVTAHIVVKGKRQLRERKEKGKL